MRFLLSGDEDVRVGVQIAQNYGVRVHLLGIHPARGSQSHQLMQESDTTTEWGKDEIRRFLSIKEGDQKSESSAPQDKSNLIVGINIPIDANAKIEESTREFVNRLEPTELHGIDTYWETERGVPVDIDRKLLPTCRDAIGRPLDNSEKRLMRSFFQKTRSRASGTRALNPNFRI